MRTHVLLLAGVVTLSGCGIGERFEEGHAELKAAEAKASAQVCADQAKAVEPPRGFPDVPLPQSTVVTGHEKRSDGRLIVVAVTPGNVKATLHFLQRSWTASGYALGEGEVEEHDAESNWSGHGYRGRWAIRTLPGCGGDTLVTVLAQKVS